MICVGNLLGLFSKFVGSGEYWECCDIEGCTGLSTIIGCSSLFSEIMFV